jgi:hypothetical protein
LIWPDRKAFFHVVVEEIRQHARHDVRSNSLGATHEQRTQGRRGLDFMKGLFPPDFSGDTR